MDRSGTWLRHGWAPILLLGLLLFLGGNWGVLEYGIAGPPKLLHEDCRQRGLKACVVGRSILPYRLQTILPVAIQERFRYLCGVHLENLTAETKDLDFLIDYPQLEAVDLSHGQIETGAVRSLRALPRLKRIGFQYHPQLDIEAVLDECAQIPTLKQLGLYVPYFPDDVLERFQRARPDVKVYLGRARASSCFSVEAEPFAQGGVAKK